MTAFATTAPVGSVTTPCRLEVTTWACAAAPTHTTASKNRLPLRWFMRGSLAPPFSQRRNSVLRLTSDLPRIFFLDSQAEGIVHRRAFSRGGTQMQKESRRGWWAFENSEHLSGWGACYPWRDFGAANGINVGSLTLLLPLIRRNLRSFKRPN